jgi:predicted RNA binding protein YcfA (HicA-like mRNA interferase family)
MLKASETINVLEKHSFVVVRQKGNHVRLHHEDGWVTSVPNHPGQDIGKGLLRKILRDTELTLDQLLSDK